MGATAGSPCAPEEVSNGRDVPTPAAGGAHASAVQGGGNSAQRLQPRGPKLLHNRRRAEAVDRAHPLPAGLRLDVFGRNRETLGWAKRWTSSLGLDAEARSPPPP